MPSLTKLLERPEFLRWTRGIAEPVKTSLPYALSGGLLAAYGAGRPDDAEAMTVWHGSPHNFNKFDISKIGTGEGAQAYGHGLYFAGGKDVAEHYRKTLSPGTGNTDFDTMSRILSAAGGDSREAARIARERASLQHLDESGKKRFLDMADKFESGWNGNGQLYEVNIPESHTLLDWDKPLSEQPEAVKKALEKSGHLNGGNDKYVGQLRRKAQKEFENNGPMFFSQDRFDSALNEAIESGDYGETFGPRVWDELKDAAPGIDWKKVRYRLSNSGVQSGTGKGLYGELASRLGSEQKASEYLRSLGIPNLSRGIRRG